MMASEKLETLVEIQNEESNMKEDSMWIDHASGCDVIGTLFGFTVAFLLVAYSGSFGSIKTIVNPYKRKFSNLTYQKLESDTIYANYLNRFVSIDVVMKRTSVVREITPIDIEFNIALSGTSETLSKFNRTFVGLQLEENPENPNTTIPVTMFRDRRFAYRNIDSNVVIKSPNKTNYVEIMLIHRIGNPEFGQYQIYHRGIFIVIELAVVLMFLRKKGFSKLQEWSNEQRLSVTLVILAIFANNPLQCLGESAPRFVNLCIESTTAPMFHAMCLATIVMTFQRISDKNSKHTIIFKAGIMLFAGFIFLVEMLNSTYDIYDEVKGHSLRQTSVKTLLVMADISMKTIFVMWTIQLFFRCALNIDLTERFRFFLYLGGSLYILIGVSAVSVIGKIYSWWEGDSIVEWISMFVVFNVFALFMMYVHWPYDPSDNQYEDRELQPMIATIQSDIAPDTEGFICDEASEEEDAML